MKLGANTKIESIYYFLDESGYPYLSYDEEYQEKQFEVDYNGLKLIVARSNNMDADNEQLTINTFSYFIKVGRRIINNSAKDVPKILDYLKSRYAEGGLTMKAPKLLAPNGKPSKLTPEQYLLVRTPEFKAWFGDWESSPETASKILDDNGEPLPVYHGTNSEPFVVFYDGSFFTDDYMNADGYASGEMIYEVFLNIKKPLIINARGRKWDNLKNKYGNSTRDIASELDTDKYDGVIFNNINDNWFDDEMGDTQNVYFTINSTQIKLADGTNTTFDSNNPDIRYEIGGIFQGTPHEFNRYSTEYMGTGEGQQVFGWGLYFTDIKDIAKQYAKNELLIQKAIAEKSNDSAHLWIYSNIPSQVQDKLAYLKNELNDLEEKQSKYPKLDLADKIKTYKDLIDIVENYKGNIYSVTLFKGDNESDYDLLLWDSAVNIKQLEKIFIEAEKMGGIPLKKGWYFSTTKQYELTPELLSAGYDTVNLYNERSSLVRGHSLYTHLSNELGSDKEASLFLLRAGIDGIKYKSGTLSNMAHKEGYNYVIFDENKITIEGKERFYLGGTTMRKPKMSFKRIHK